MNYSIVMTWVAAGGCLALALRAAEPPKPTFTKQQTQIRQNLAVNPAIVPEYTIPTVIPANIASTMTPAMRGQVEVSGKPRISQGHPCTLWDQEDIADYRSMLKNNTALQSLYAKLKDVTDKQISKPVVIPLPQKGPDGQWLYPGEYFPPHPDFPKDDAVGRFRHHFFSDTTAISDLAIMYALSGDDKYGEYAKKVLLAYATGFPNYGSRAGYDLRFAQGVATQLLDEGIALSVLSISYDLIYNLPSWTAEERKQIHDGLLWVLAAEMLYPGAPELDVNGCHATQLNNRGAQTISGVLLAGYATDDQNLVNAALYGIKSTIARSDVTRRKTFPPPKDWVEGTAEKQYGGLLQRHLTQCIGADGMWIEGSPSYSLYAANGLVLCAESAWHHGLDLYSYNNAILKRFFDFPLIIAYPDATLPGLNDGARSPLAAGKNPALYEYAYRRYLDPRYLSAFSYEQKPGVVNWQQPNPFIRISPVGGTPPTLLFNQVNRKASSATSELPDMNFSSVGYGILRTPGAAGINNLTFSYGASSSHGHPDKLQIDLFAFNDVLMPSPGINFPYNNNPRIEKWYHTTLSHNNLTVDGKRQFYLGGENPKGLNPHADQIVFGPAQTMGIQRGWTNTVYECVILDRAVFMTKHYLADLFGAFSSTPHDYDLAWHIRGTPSAELQFKPMSFAEPVPNGYNFLTNTRSKLTYGPWSLDVTRKGRTARLVATQSQSATEVILGDGGIFVDYTSMDEESTGKPTALTILQRRVDQAATLYGNAVDLTGNAGEYVKKVIQEGGLSAGYGLLKIETEEGTDLCFSSYRPEKYKVGDLETDALQAMVLMEGSNLRAMYLAGGTMLKYGNLVIQRSEPGLACIEKLEDGSYQIANPSPTDATITLIVPSLSDYMIKSKMSLPQPQSTVAADGTFKVNLSAGTVYVLQKSFP